MRLGVDTALVDSGLAQALQRLGKARIDQRGIDAQPHRIDQRTALLWERSPRGQQCSS